jgi:nucleoside-diphosphate-sugar epimerase
MMWPVALGVEVLGKLARRDVPLTRYRLKRATESLIYDTTAARDGLGWTPSVDLPTGVRAMADAAAGPTVS